jgi:DNA-binding transcriptional LysR family regulator
MSVPGDLQLTQLQLFLRLADAGTLSAAARQLQLTPAAASASLKRLEASLKVRLVERSTRSLRLTPEGELLREHAQRALSSLDEALSLLGAQRERLDGEIHLAAPSDLGRELLSPMLDGFLQRHPGLRLALHLSDSMHDLRRERVDVAVRYGTLRDSGLVARHLHTTTRVLVAAPAYLAAHGTPQHPGDLEQHNCLVLNLGGRPHLAWPFTKGTQTVQVKVQGNRRADDGALVRQWALQGLGLAYKARLDVLADLQAGRLVALLPQWTREAFALHAILPDNRHVPLRVRRLVDELVAQFTRIEGDTLTPAANTPAD